MGETYHVPFVKTVLFTHKAMSGNSADFTVPGDTDFRGVFPHSRKPMRLNGPFWQRSLGLEEYEAVFRDNKINERVLPNLTQEDLKEIGVGPVGHRRILLDGIVALPNHGSTQTPSVTAATPSPSAPTPTAAPVAEPVGERRHVTVMFCDLVGSTSISAGLDAEDWRDLVGSYLDAASAAVTEMGGHVAKKLGDGLMALFGYPVAHENDAERRRFWQANAQRRLSGAKQPDRQACSSPRNAVVIN
jgi:SAM domain (Sterile alpha motif)/Adenylate and Guanylate cyclase catalytic domain